MTSSLRNLFSSYRLFLIFSVLWILACQPAFAASPTATTLAVTSGGSAPTSIPTYTAVTLTASVTSAGSPVTLGQVYFCNAIEPGCNYTNNLATAQLTSAGKATFSLMPGPGSHSYVAVFAGTTTYNASTSATSASFTVTGKTHTNAIVSSSGSPGDYTLTSTIYGAGSTAPTGDITFLGTPTTTNGIQSGSLITLASASLVANAPPTTSCSR